MEMKTSRTFIAVPPGATIREQLDDRGMSQKEFSSRMGMSEKHISRLINGDVQLTPEVAYKLEMVLGVPAEFWNNLEAIYREKLVKVEMENALDADKELAKKFPYTEMAAMGWVPTTRKSNERVVNLRKYFEVAQLGRLENAELIPAIACRRLSITEKGDFALIAWAQRAKIEARYIETTRTNLCELEKRLPEIRALTLKEPSSFCEELSDLMTNCGIAPVFLPHLSGSFLHGATFYDNGKIVMGLTLRGKDADRFWFSLFHEIGHIMLGHLTKSTGADNADEEAADCFAKDVLIPPDEYNSFLKKSIFTREAIIDFAASIGIAPGIIVGRLQKEGHVDFNRLNDLKVKYELTSNADF